MADKNAMYRVWKNGRTLCGNVKSERLYHKCVKGYVL